MVVPHAVAERFRHEREAVRGEGQSLAGDDQGAEEAHLRPLDVVHAAGVADDADVETRVMRHHHVITDELDDRREHVLPARRVLDNLGRDAVHPYVEGVEPVGPGWRSDEPAAFVHDHAVTYADQADRTWGAPVGVGGLEVDGAVVEHGHTGACAWRRSAKASGKGSGPGEFIASGMIHGVFPVRG